MSWSSKAHKDHSLHKGVRTYWQLPLVVQSILGSTIHHATIADDMMRVVVVDVRDATTRVPVPTQEVKTVGQAPGNFILWPVRLAKVITKEVIVLTCFNYAFIYIGVY